MISKQRLELFSDAVIAIVLTVMLINLDAPRDAGWLVWEEKSADLLAYALGFILVSFCWLIHHQVFEHTRIITGRMLAANFAYLFLLSLIPMLVHGIAKHPHDSAPVLQMTVVGYLQIQMITVFRLLGRRQHWHDPGYQAWHRRRNRIALLGIPQVFAVLLTALYRPVVAEVLIGGIALAAGVTWMK